MAGIIRHGPPGSYKSALIVQNHIIPALAEGRIVVTNVEGMYPLDIIKKALKGKFEFPESARLIRIGSATLEFQDIWQHWPSWLPLGAMLVMDEAQDVYPKEFKSNFAIRPFEDFKDRLPEQLVDSYYNQLDSMRPTDFDEGDTDDTGESRFDEEGKVVYPLTLNSAYKRHRKYNWDLVFGTPDISEISMMIRGAFELAFVHRARDEFFLTKRKPNVSQHNPKTTGLSLKKGATSVEKVHLYVFLTYKSTQTGLQTKSGQGTNPLGFFVIMVLIVGILGMIYGGTVIYDSFFSSVVSGGEDTGQVGDAVQVSSENLPKDNKKRLEVHEPSSKESSGLSMRISGIQNASLGNVGIDLPYSADTLYLVGYAHPSMYIFEVAFKGETFQVNSDDLLTLGWRANLETDGLVLLDNYLTGQYFYAAFNPKSKREVIDDDRSSNDSTYNQEQNTATSNTFDNNLLFGNG